MLFRLAHTVDRHGVRVVDAADNILGNGICREVQYNETFEAVFGSLEGDGRPHQAVRLLQLANAPLQSTIQVPSTHADERIMHFCCTAGVLLPSVIVMTACSKPTTLKSLRDPVVNCTMRSMQSWQGQNSYIIILTTYQGRM
jgi:hypothetical protein